MDGPDDVIHQPIRLRVMAALTALDSSEEGLDFVRLRNLTNATDGNLGAHLTTLENAGYIAIEKDFVAKKPRTRVGLTRVGRRAFARHVSYLRDIIDGGRADRIEEKSS